MLSQAIEAPTGIDENVHDLDGTIIKTWRLKNNPELRSRLQKIRGFDAFMDRSPQINTLLTHGKIGEVYQFMKIDQFQLRKWFEQHSKGGGIRVCEESEDKKKELELLLERFLRRHPHKDPRRMAIIGNNCKCELQYGIDMGVTVIRIRHPGDPHADDDLTGAHHVARDWYEVMALPFYRSSYEDILARRA